MAMREERNAMMGRSWGHHYELTEVCSSAWQGSRERLASSSSPWGSQGNRRRPAHLGGPVGSVAVIHEFGGAGLKRSLLPERPHRHQALQAGEVRPAPE